VTLIILVLKKIIEYNGGRLENTVISKESGKEVLRYWIEL